MAKIVHPDEEFDTGPHGYAQTLRVVDVQKADESFLQEKKATRSQAEAILSVEGWNVTFATNMDGSGLYANMVFSEDDAKLFEVSDTVTFHYYRDRVPGGGKLAYIETQRKEPASAPTL